MTRSTAMIQQILWDPSSKQRYLPFPITNCDSHFIQLNYVPQVGPQCGFAALCMIASFADINLNPDELVSKAKEKNMSNHGEMFSSYNMSVFAKDLFRSNFEVTLFKTSIKGQSYQIKKYLNDNCLILIPYDCDFNNEPCLKNGTAAHWAVVCGYVGVNSEEENLYIIACHAKSQHAGVWKYSDLQASNDNLRELGSKRKSDGKEYIVPAGGLQEGIASSWILFKKLK